MKKETKISVLFSISLVLIIVALFLGYMARDMLYQQEERRTTERDIKCSISPYHAINNTSGYVITKCKAPFFQGGSVLNISLEGSG